MAKFDIEKLLTQYTKDGATDFAKVNEELESQNKNIVAKAVSKETAKFDKNAVIDEFLKANEFKSLDEFNAFKKNGVTADSEAVKRLEGIIAEKDNTIKELTPFKTKAVTYENRALLRSAGLQDNDQVEFYEWKINQMEGDTFADKFKTFQEANKELFQVNPPTKPTTGTKITTKENNSVYDFEKILDDKHGGQLLGK